MIRMNPSRSPLKGRSIIQKRALHTVKKRREEGGNGWKCLAKHCVPKNSDSICAVQEEREKSRKYLEASFHLMPVIPNVLPQLKPNHPHHSMKVPKSTFVGEAICFGGEFLSNRPLRGFSITVATKPLTPPTKCTALHPAMSTAPIVCRKPFSSQIQCAGKLYVRVFRNEYKM